MRSLVEGKGPTGSGRCGQLCEDPRAKSPEEPQGDESSHLKNILIFGYAPIAFADLQPYSEIQHLINLNPAHRVSFRFF